jgi:hypothetical protein
VVRPCLSRWLLTFISLLPSTVAAQITAGPAHDVLLDDVGTWDAEIVVWDVGRRPRVSRGVEFNTLGCNGTCLVTTIHGNLRDAAPGGYSPRVRTGMTADRSEPTPVPGSGRYVPTGDWSPEFISAPGDTVGRRSEVRPRSMSPDARLQALTGPVPAARTSFAYPQPGVRIVTLYRHDPKGHEVRVARIVYTRRK